MAILPPELTSSIIDHVWDDTRETGCYETISSCSLCCKSFYHETRRRLFRQIELRDAGSPILQLSYPRSSNRITRFRSLLQNNPQLGNYVVSIYLSLPWTRRPRRIATGQSYPDLPFVMKQLRRLKSLVFESHSRIDWVKLDEPIRMAIKHAFAGGGLVSVKFGNVCNLPASLFGMGRVLGSVKLRDVVVVCDSQNGNGKELEGKDGGAAGEGEKESEAGTWTKLYVEHSAFNVLLTHSPSRFENLQSLHTRLVMNRDTQQLIDTAHRTLEEFSCEGKAMNHYGSSSDSEGAAGVGPFSFKTCTALQTLHFRYNTPRGNIHDFSKVVCSSLQTLHESKLCIDELKLSFLSSTETDLVNLLGSPFWSRLDTLHSIRPMFKRVRVSLQTGKPRYLQQVVVIPARRESSSAGHSETSTVVKDAIERTKDSLPSLVRSDAITFSVSASRPSCRTTFISLPPMVTQGLYNQ
ncbi:hypothetical protein CC2G_013097 [Coprinopsis cinerea AmutBmut pab1-1]|nr:hypothetical protein CC2G_013097 [Coprinopsis cinerea AmutBmut pab1-1]